MSQSLMPVSYWVSHASTHCNTSPCLALYADYMYREVYLTVCIVLTYGFVHLFLPPMHVTHLSLFNLPTWLSATFLQQQHLVVIVFVVPSADWCRCRTGVWVGQQLQSLCAVWIVMETVARPAEACQCGPSRSLGSLHITAQLQTCLG